MNGTIAPYKTTFYGLYDRSASFDEQCRHLTCRSVTSTAATKLDLATPLDFVSTDDIIGGNSGSPVINRNARTGGPDLRRQHRIARRRFVYDGTLNRAVAVDSAAMMEALRKLYGAGKLADEIEGK